MESLKFEEGNIYGMNFIGDSELKIKWICIKITAKTASFKKTTNSLNLCEDEIITRKIKTYNNIDYIVDGSYSMAPAIYANNVVG